MNWTEVVKACAWPVVVAFIGILFRKPFDSIFGTLNDLLRRRWAISVAGVKLDFATEQQPDPAVPRLSDSMELQEFPSLPRTKAIAALETQIHGQIRIANQPSDQMVNLLVRNLAQARLEAYFGYLYATLFGSQIRGLEQLAARRHVTAAEAFGFFEEATSADKEFFAGYGFGGWIGYLKNTGLASQDDDAVRITDQGDDFLTWLAARNLPKNKLH